MAQSPPDRPETISLGAAYGRLWRDWLRPHLPALLFSALLMLIVAIAAAGYAKFMEWVINAYEMSAQDVIYWGPLGIISLVLVKGGAQYWYQLIQNRILSRVQADMQTRMFDTLLGMDLSNLLAESPAALAARFSADIDLIRYAAREVFGSITAILTVLATFAVMLSIDWAMTIGLIGIFALAFGPVGIVGSRVRRIASKTQEEIATMTANVNEGLASIRMVRTYQLENRMKRGAGRVFERLFQLRIDLVKWQATLSPMMEILGGLAIGALLFLVALRMQTGAIDLGGFIGLLTALGVATNPARKLGGAYAVGLQGMAALERVFRLYDTPVSVKGGDVVLSVDQRAKGGLSFENVDFIYPDGYQALFEFDLKIEAGKRYAFVGRSGAGKSTVFNLLPRLFDVSGGQITLDGRDIRDLTLQSLRDQISIVSQDSVMLTGTIAENIAFGRENAPLEDIIAAAQAAAADEFITRLPDGYQTIIDPSKSEFSGGERQRLSIARAILRDAPILLLDEPTSALDAASEAAIREALDRLASGRTTLIIAHRLSTIMDADQIVVMDQGRLADQGTHEELLEGGGIYAELYNLQFDMPAENVTARRQNGDDSVLRSPLARVSQFFRFGLTGRE